MYLLFHSLTSKMFTSSEILELYLVSLLGAQVKYIRRWHLTKTNQKGTVLLLYQVFNPMLTLFRDVLCYVITIS